MAWIPKRHFTSLVDGLVEAGWIVEAEGHVIRQPGRYQISVTSGVDWFDLEGQCEFDGEVVQLPKLLAALRQGEKFVTLDDGSRGLLPRDWLDRFSHRESGHPWQACLATRRIMSQSRLARMQCIE